VSDSFVLDEGLASLLSERVSTIDRLQLLLVLHASAGRSFTASELAEQAGIPVDTAAEDLEGLHGAGLAGREEGTDPLRYRYAPADAGLGTLVDRLEKAWIHSPVPVVRLLAARAIERVRTAALLTFADAFVLGSKSDG
jgi:DNA-binding IclR family transcriptional regulator